MNLVDEYPRRRGAGGDALPVDAARLGAERVLRAHRNKNVLLLGRAVADACGVREAEWLRWYFVDVGRLETDERCVVVHDGLNDKFLAWHRARPAANLLVGRRVALVPHTSGMSRWWNDVVHRRAASRFLREAMRGEEVAA